MFKLLMKQIGFVTVNEAEEYDSTLIYKVGEKSYSRKIVDYFIDDGISFRDRYEGDFTLDGINAEEIKIINFNEKLILDFDERRKKKKYIDRIELMMFLYADIVENRRRMNTDLFEDLITRFKMATSYNPRTIEKDIDAVIDFMKTDVWVDLYGKTYDDFTLTN